MMLADPSSSEAEPPASASPASSPPAWASPASPASSVASPFSPRARSSSSPPVSSVAPSSRAGASSRASASSRAPSESLSGHGARSASESSSRKEASSDSESSDSDSDSDSRLPPAADSDSDSDGADSATAAAPAAASDAPGAGAAPPSAGAASASASSKATSSASDTSGTDSETSGQHAEQFRPEASAKFLGLAEHVKQHAESSDVNKCHLCHVCKNLFTWSLRFAYEDKATGQKLPWIACSKLGKALCLPCSESGAGRCEIALGLGLFKYCNLQRHEKAESHKRAVLLVQERGKQEAAQCYSTVRESAREEVKITHEMPARLTAGQFVLLRVMVETRGSFRDFERWAAAAADGDRVLNRDVCQQGVATMASVERALTRELLMSASACRLQADGLERIYQVEMGMVIWKFPQWGSWLLRSGRDRPWMRELGDRGPWLVDRVIGARELRAGLDTAGKVDMVAECVLRACSGPRGDANAAELHKRVCSNILSWASDGADLSVGDAATSHFENMVFRDWEESHSAAKLLAHAVALHPEARLVDGLLVTGVDSAPNLPNAKKAPSLAKFLTTSLVFKKRSTEAQRNSGVAAVAA